MLRSAYSFSQKLTTEDVRYNRYIYIYTHTYLYNTYTYQVSCLQSPMSDVCQQVKQHSTSPNTKQLLDHVIKFQLFGGRYRTVAILSQTPQSNKYSELYTPADLTNLYKKTQT